MAKQLKYNVLLMIVTAMLLAGKPPAAFGQNIPGPIDTAFVTFLDAALSKPGDSVLFKGVWYEVCDADKTYPNLGFEGWPQVKAMAVFAGQRDGIYFHLDFYTITDGNDDYNLKLSQRRADMFNRYFVQWGMQPEKIIANGRGESANFNHFKASTTMVFKMLPKN